MITDLFSHKIHSSGEDWPDKLVELAILFSEFHGDVYDREEIEKRLKEISPRAAYAPRDPSKFRDEISAYPAYLGLYHLIPSKKGWLVYLSEAAKTFLLKEEPDVGAFMRLQLTLFQYPNGMGAAYKSFTNKLRIQANARERTLSFIEKGIHLSPLRLITQSLIVIAKLKSISIFDASVSYEEIFALANDIRVTKDALPDMKAIAQSLDDFRRGLIKAPKHYESRFHILNHTELFEVGATKISFRKHVNNLDELDLREKINEIVKINSQFNGFDNVRNGKELAAEIGKGDWGNYFDGQKTLRAESVKKLAADLIDIAIYGRKEEKAAPPGIDTYSLTERKEYKTSSALKTRQNQLANPELTKIKRERQNLIHKILIDKMAEHLKKYGAKPLENPHIGLYAELPNDGAYLFEMKSGGENSLNQIRKGLSQLYEYRFRYRSQIYKDVILCLVVPEDPKEIPWIHEYLCKDRDICICWFNKENQLEYPSHCKGKMEIIVAS